MLSILRSAVSSYLVVTGVVTVAALVSRGLIRSVGHLLEGETALAGKGALAALARPAVLAQTALAGLIMDVLDKAGEDVHQIEELAVSLRPSAA